MAPIKSSALLLLTLGLIGCSAEPMPEVQQQFELDLQAGRVEQRDGYYAFPPTAAQPAKHSCFVFYPGALVDAVAYAPLMRSVSAAGYPSYLLQLPMNLAVMAMDAADKVKADAQASQQCQSYVIGGHSLGGVAAANYAIANPNDGLLLLASYPQESKPITEHQGAAVSIFASNDGLTTLADIYASKTTMPAATRWVEVKGGNHAKFGWYGVQDGDGESDITREQQQAIVLQVALELLDQVNAGQ